MIILYNYTNEQKEGELTVTNGKWAGPGLNNWQVTAGYGLLNTDEAVEGVQQEIDDDNIKEINMVDNVATASTDTKWNENENYVAPTRHDYSNDSRDRIKFLKNMVGHEVPDSFDPHEISWVLPNLGVTGAEGAEQAIKKGQFVINVAGELHNEATVKMPIEPTVKGWDTNKQNTILPTLESIVNTMEMAMATEQKVVVHCSMGMERSVLATVWYLVRNKGMSLNNAYSFVRSVRPIATDRREWLIA